MHMFTKKLITAGAAALIALSTFGTVASAERRSGGDGAGRQIGIAPNISNRGLSNGGQLRNRNFGNNVNRRNFGDNNHNYNHRRHHNRRGYGNRFGGIYLNFGSTGSGCGYSYRKWQATGSRYWRNRYYDCVS
jgi:hypothetical protein